MTAVLTESAAWGVGVGLVVDRVQTFSADNVYSCPCWGPSLGGNRHERAWVPAVGPWPALPCPSLPSSSLLSPSLSFPFCRCVSLISIAYTLTLSRDDVVAGGAPRTLITAWAAEAGSQCDAMRCDVIVMDLRRRALDPSHPSIAWPCASDCNNDGGKGTRDSGNSRARMP